MAFVNERNSRLLKQAANLKSRASLQPRFVPALYLLQASVSLDALLNFWNHDGMQSAFDGSPNFLEERLAMLESLYQFVVSNGQIQLKLPPWEDPQLPVKQFIATTCQSDITLTLVPKSCVLEAYRQRFGDADDLMIQICDQFQALVCHWFMERHNVKARSLIRVGQICGDDKQSLKDARRVAERFRKVSNPLVGMVVLEWLLLRAAIREPGVLGRSCTPATRDLWQLNLQRMQQASLSYMKYHNVDCYLEETRRMLSSLKLESQSHDDWCAEWKADARVRKDLRSSCCWAWPPRWLVESLSCFWRK